MLSPMGWVHAPPPVLVAGGLLTFLICAGRCTEGRGWGGEGGGPSGPFPSPSPGYRELTNA